MLFLPGRLQGRGPYAPPGKPIRTYPFGVKITRGVESANLSTEMQYQVNRRIFAEDMSYFFFR